MKKLALLLVFVFVLSFSLSFADIIAPVEEQNATTENVEAESGTTVSEEVNASAAENTNEQTIEVVSDQEVADPAQEDAQSGETTPVNSETAAEETVESEKTSNPVGGIVAIVVIIVLVLLVALVSKK